MTTEEINISLFEFYNQHKEFVLVQCISSDFAMGAGIAVEFNNIFNVKRIVQRTCIPYWSKQGYCLSILKYVPVLNLVTKYHYFDKPTYQTISDALYDMKNIVIANDIKYIAMPRIGTGLDGLQWNKVYSIIKETFSDIEIDIKICYI